MKPEYSNSKICQNTMSTWTLWLKKLWNGTNREFEYDDDHYRPARTLAESRRRVLAAQERARKQLDLINKVC